MEDLRYPIGKFNAQEHHSPSEIAAFLERIESLPAKLEQAIIGLTDHQLDTPYREGGWTLRQVVHHVADSHLNAYIRTKWILTEDSPLIKAYFEKLWAETPETKSEPSLSINLLKALHRKWVVLLRSLSPDHLNRELLHPETKKSIALHNLVAMYAWHGDHHLAHIVNLKKRNGW